MTSIMFLGGLSLAIGMWGGGELGEDGARTGETGSVFLGGKGNNRGFEEKVIELDGAEFYLSVEAATMIGGGLVKPGVGKSSEVLRLNHGTTSVEKGVKKLSPSNPRPKGENSTGTLPKFKVWETPTYSMIRKWEVDMGVSIGGQWKSSEIPGSTVEVLSRRAFPFLMIFFGSTSGVAKGSCGVDLVCMTLEATV